MASRRGKRRRPSKPSSAAERAFFRQTVVGAELEGRVKSRADFGLFIGFGPAVGLCHRSNLGLFALDDVPVGTLVTVRVLEVTPEEGRVSLALVSVIGAESAGSARKASPRTSRRVADGAIHGDQTAYARAAAAAIDEGTASLNDVGQQFAKNSSASRAGFVAEADHTATYNVDAAFKRSRTRAHRPAVNTKKSSDINVVDDAGKVVSQTSSKVYKNAEATAKAQRGYGEQSRLVPKDQLKKVKSHARSRAASESAKGRPNRDAVAAEWDEVATQATDRVQHDGVSSKPRTRQQTRELARKARAGKASGRDISGEVAERASQGAKSGAKSGAVAGAAVGVVVETFSAVKAVRSGEKTAGEAALGAAAGVVLGVADGAAKGAAGGAASGAAQVLAQRAGSGIAKSFLKGSGPAAVAITGVEVAKHAVLLASGRIDASQFRSAAADSVKSGTASYVGSSIGAAIGGPPGAIIGGIVGPIVVSQAEQHGLVARLERAFTGNTAPGHYGSDAFHLEHRGSMERVMDASDGAIFLNRVVPADRGRHLSAAAVVLQGERLFAIDFKAWRGELGFSPIIQQRKVKREAFFGLISYEDKESYDTGEVDEREVVQVKTSGGGNTYRKVHRNPVRRLQSFAMALRSWLSRQDRRWASVWVETLVVFPTDEVSLSSELRRSGSFMTTADLTRRLASSTGRSPSWRVDGLSATPTWDLLENPRGDIYQGLIKNESVPLVLPDGSLDVPFTSILKVEVQRGGTFSRSDAVTVVLRSGETLAGTVEKLKLVINRMGYEKEFLLRDLKKVVPASTLFSMDLLGCRSAGRRGGGARKRSPRW